MQRLKHPVWQLVLAAILWSSGGLFIKKVDWHPLAISGGRSLIAGLTILAFLPRTRISFSPVQIAGALAYTGTVLLFVCANKMTTAANAIFLQYTAPIYIALFGAWLLKEHPSRLDWILIGVMQAGTALFFFGQLSLAGLWGNVLALASGVSFASMALLLRKQKDGSPASSVLLGNFLTALIGLPFMLSNPVSKESLLNLAFLGVFQLGLAYVLYTSAIRQVRALEATLISTIEPVLNPIWVALFLDEKPTGWTLAGGAVVIGAATVRGVVTARNQEAA
ncbi:MAG TPA: EamA family transporter [Verrucomicrobiae bacterium]|nr:EamA family transporter [Verrucomicrobiae bacterium]